MRSASTFATILAVGVLIVLIYQWSGDSIIVLIMSLLTLFALLALWDRKPWEASVGGDDQWPERDDNDRRRSNAHHESHGDETDGPKIAGPEAVGSETVGAVESNNQDRPAEKTRPAVRPLTEDSPVWRCRFDVIVDGNGVTGLALGEREPRQWQWDSVVSAGVGWSAAIAAQDEVEERVGLHLGLLAEPATGRTVSGPDIADEVIENAQLMFGAEQHAGAVLGAVRRGIKTARIQRSRFYNLSPGERTRRLANALSPDPIHLTKHIRSPELLYQEARRTLLTNRTLRRISREADAEQLLTALEQLLTAHGATELNELELSPLGAAADRDDSETVYLGGNKVVEARGYRMAFIHHGGDDHLVGLLTLDEADDWDGQTVGSGLNSVSLAPPTYG